MSDYLCISEKPTAAKRIAQALDDQSNPKKVSTPKSYSNVPVWKSTHNGKSIITIPALGHLYSTVEDSGGGWHYPAFSYKWVPSYIADSKNKTRSFVLAFKKFSKEVDEIIVATDYDLEGEVIGATIAKFACGKKLTDVKRMLFSTLTKEDITTSFENLKPTVNLGLAAAGFTRHEIDWLFGINLTRALTLAIKHSTGRYKLLSTGRVQGPTLKFIADREREIQTFVPKPRWVIKAAIDLDGEVIDLEYSKKYILTLQKANTIVEEATKKEGKVKEINARKITQKPPKPFNLSRLQSEAYRYFKFSPSKTLRIAESLYLKALISYPRTGSQQFPKTINHKKILQQLKKLKEFKSRAEKLLMKEKLIPTFGKKKDPAHPPIHPTGKNPGNIRGNEKKIYQLITCRYLAIFGKPAIKESLRLDIVFNNLLFYLRGMRILRKGWLGLYQPFGKLGEVELPDLKKGDKVTLAEIYHQQSYTRPPARYNPNSLLQKMESEELGTKATRSGIIDKLYSRGYVEDERMIATDLGFAVIDTLEKYSPTIISSDLTRELEKEMEQIREGEKEKEKVLLATIRELKNILEQFFEKEQIIGVTLQEQVQNLKQRQRILGPCPICGQGELIITRSRRTKKRFVGCTGFYKKVCSWSAPIPQKGYARPAKKNCKECGFPMITIRPKGKRPYTICSNWLHCPGTPDEVLENYKTNKNKALEEMTDVNQKEAKNK
ncbi:MAG: DNA topoisomerase I [Asgard group archaeon]|nr:DNA topoisomerase I [Asgard group archaeon]